MKNEIKWHKEYIGGKWFSVADAAHIPMIERCKDGMFKLRNVNGKSIFNRRFSDAVKLALEIARKFRKFNRGFAG